MWPISPWAATPPWASKPLEGSAPSRVHRVETRGGDIKDLSWDFLKYVGTYYIHGCGPMIWLSRKNIRVRMGHDVCIAWYNPRTGNSLRIHKRWPQMGPRWFQSKTGKCDIKFCSKPSNWNRTEWDMFQHPHRMPASHCLKSVNPPSTWPRTGYHMFFLSKFLD